MSNIVKKLLEAQTWLINDQYSHGEMGRCEATNPTDDPRNFQLSRIKPNLFISSQAILSLLATGCTQQDVFEKFFGWLNRLRRPDGYWTSASGSMIPAGKGRGWSEVKNIRHTAKALDLLFLRGEFVPEDALILHNILSTQRESGAFPQHPDGHDDIWSTAYLVNLIIRSLHPLNIPKTLPRNTTEEAWATMLRSRLDRARAWICSQINKDGLWHLGDSDPFWITEAVLSEIGADLSINRPDFCRQIASRLIERIDRSRTLAIWGLLLILHTLNAEQQRTILTLVNDMAQADLPKDTFDVSSYCKLLWLSSQPHILNYYIIESLGHESTLKSWAPWNRTEYFKWCIEKAIKERENKNLMFNANPANRAEAWCTVAYILNSFKRQIEEHRGWELLWVDSKTPRNEKAVQISFWNLVNLICEKEGLLVREPDTGAGPVDFEFVNGFHEKILIEFKLASNQRLEHGIKVQLPTYMKAQNIDSAFVVIIGFTEKDLIAYENVVDIISDYLKNNPKFYIESFYIDASRRKSASKR